MVRSSTVTVAVRYEGIQIYRYTGIEVSRYLGIKVYGYLGLLCKVCCARRAQWSRDGCAQEKPASQVLLPDADLLGPAPPTLEGRRGILSAEDSIGSTGPPPHSPARPQGSAQATPGRGEERVLGGRAGEQVLPGWAHRAVGLAVGEEEGELAALVVLRTTADASRRETQRCSAVCVCWVWVCMGGRHIPLR